MTELTVKRHKLHAKQRTILTERKRFNVVKSGRRFGKSALSINLLIESVLKGHYVGFWYPVYRDGLEVWTEVKTRLYEIIDKKDEAAKILRFINGAKVDFWSMEDPNSGRGRKYHRIIIDECEKALKFEEAWTQAIAPTLTDFGGDAYFLSTPQFGDTYFKRLCKQELIQPETWKTFVYSTYDNPYIDRDEIEMMRSILPALVFDCEYLAADVDGKSMNPFLYALNTDVHYNTDVHLDWKKQLHIGIDFNLNPFAVVFANIWRDEAGLNVNFVNEFSIDNGSLQSMAQRIKAMYSNLLPNAKLTGDSLGKNRNIALADNASNYETLRRFMGLREGQIIVPNNPTHEQSRNDFNYLLHVSSDPANMIKVRVNPSTCPGLAGDMRMVQCDATGAMVKGNRKDLSQKADFLDCARYLINTFVKGEIERHQKSNFGKLNFK
jgi:hypothetical protein